MKLQEIKKFWNNYRFELFSYRTQRLIQEQKFDKVFRKIKYTNWNRFHDEDCEKVLQLLIFSHSKHSVFHESIDYFAQKLSDERYIRLLSRLLSTEYDKAENTFQKTSRDWLIGKEEVNPILIRHMKNNPLMALVFDSIFLNRQEIYLNQLLSAPQTKAWINEQEHFFLLLQSMIESKNIEYFETLLNHFEGSLEIVVDYANTLLRLEQRKDEDNRKKNLEKQNVALNLIATLSRKKLSDKLSLKDTNHIKRKKI